MKEEKKRKYTSLRDVLGDKKLVRDIKTTIILLFALAIGVITNGVFDGFTIQTLFQITVAISTIGLMLSVFMVTNDFANRGEEEEEEDNEDIRNAKAEIKHTFRNVNKVKKYAKTVVKNRNIEKVKELRQDKYEDIMKDYEQKQDNIQIKIENYKLIGVRKWRIFKRLYVFNKIRRLNKKYNKIVTKAKKTRLDNIYVYYEPIELDDYRVESIGDTKVNLTPKQKLKATPSSFVKKKMAKTNLLKVFLFIGFQGMIYVGVSNWGELFWRILIVVGTLTSTAFMSYWLTRKWSDEIYVSLLEEKSAEIEGIYQEALILQSQDQDQEEPTEPIEHDPFTQAIEAQKKPVN